MTGRRILSRAYIVPKLQREPSHFRQTSENEIVSEVVVGHIHDLNNFVIQNIR